MGVPMRWSRPSLVRSALVTNLEGGIGGAGDQEEGEANLEETRAGVKGERAFPPKGRCPFQRNFSKMALTR